MLDFEKSLQNKVTFTAVFSDERLFAIFGSSVLNEVFNSLEFVASEVASEILNAERLITRSCDRIE